ncbi:hypothetical protein [Streptomyces sp. CA-111067]|uniref:hypothetical protein n=1 Tax=Streptomyces sp. CA-111067 TaxID=3240046 RepID=UPI003D996489
MHQLLSCLARLTRRRPASGRHRSPVAARAAAVTRCDVTAPLRGEDVALVRPYVLAHERRCAEARRQRRGRRRLLIAPHGLDLDPRLLPAVEVAA